MGKSPAAPARPIRQLLLEEELLLHHPPLVAPAVAQEAQPARTFPWQVASPWPVTQRTTARPTHWFLRNARFHAEFANQRQHRPQPAMLPPSLNARLPASL